MAKIFTHLLFLFFPLVSLAALLGDANADGVVNGTDFAIWKNEFQSHTSLNSDFNQNGVVEGTDFAIWKNSYLAGGISSGSPTSAPPTSPPNPSATSWNQLAADAQYSGYINEEPGGKSWSFAWHWKPADMNNMPPSAHAVVGDNKVYMPAGNQGLYAVNLSNGSQAWKLSINTIAAPAFDPSTNNLYVSSTDGKVYKVSSSGSIVSSFTGSSRFEMAVTLVGNYIYTPDSSGNLYKIDKNSMTQVWKYSAGQTADTPAAYSTSKNLLVYGTRDLKIHGVDATSGAARWTPTKPTTVPSQAEDPCSSYTYRFGWPVVSDQAGIVFFRMRMRSQEEWFYSGRPGTNRWPTTNSETRSWLESHPEKRPLFAISLATGQNAFTPAVANGGVDGDKTFPCTNVPGTLTTIGPMPVVKNIGGVDFAYILFRNSQTTDPNWDERADTHMGEMVLSNNAIPGYSAGDLRFINFAHENKIITDEATPITLAGNTIFYAHWGLIESYTITDRRASLGLTLANNIASTKNTPVIRRQNGGSADSSHWVSGDLNLFCDTRSWPGPGFWMYINESDPPGTGNPSCSDYRGGFLPRYSFASNGYIFHIGNGGDIFALKY